MSQIQRQDELIAKIRAIKSGKGYSMVRANLQRAYVKACEAMGYTNKEANEMFYDCVHVANNLDACEA